jgi:hypothetical protein
MCKKEKKSLSLEELVSLLREYKDKKDKIGKRNVKKIKDALCEKYNYLAIADVMTMELADKMLTEIEQQTINFSNECLKKIDERKERYYGKVINMVHSIDNTVRSIQMWTVEYGAHKSYGKLYHIFDVAPRVITIASNRLIEDGLFDYNGDKMPNGLSYNDFKDFRVVYRTPSEKALGDGSTKYMNRHISSDKSLTGLSVLEYNSLDAFKLFNFSYQTSIDDCQLSEFYIVKNPKAFVKKDGEPFENMVGKNPFAIVVRDYNNKKSDSFLMYTNCVTPTGQSPCPETVSEDFVKQNCVEHLMYFITGTSMAKKGQNYAIRLAYDETPEQAVKRIKKTLDIMTAGAFGIAFHAGKTFTFKQLAKAIMRLCMCMVGSKALGPISSFAYFNQPFSALSADLERESGVEVEGADGSAYMTTDELRYLLEMRFNAKLECTDEDLCQFGFQVRMGGGVVKSFTNVVPPALIYQAIKFAIEKKGLDITFTTDEAEATKCLIDGKSVVFGVSKEDFGNGKTPGILFDKNNMKLPWNLSYKYGRDINVMLFDHVFAHEGRLNSQLVVPNVAHTPELLKVVERCAIDSMQKCIDNNFKPLLSYAADTDEVANADNDAQAAYGNAVEDDDSCGKIIDPTMFLIDSFGSAGITAHEKINIINEQLCDTVIKGAQNKLLGMNFEIPSIYTHSTGDIGLLFKVTILKTDEIFCLGINRDNDFVECDVHRNPRSTYSEHLIAKAIGIKTVVSRICEHLKNGKLVKSEAAQIFQFFATRNPNDMVIPNTNRFKNLTGGSDNDWDGYTVILDKEWIDIVKKNNPSIALEYDIDDLQALQNDLASEAKVYTSQHYEMVDVFSALTFPPFDPIGIVAVRNATLLEFIMLMPKLPIGVLKFILWKVFHVKAFNYKATLKEELDGLYPNDCVIHPINYTKALEAIEYLDVENLAELQRKFEDISFFAVAVQGYTIDAVKNAITKIPEFLPWLNHDGSYCLNPELRRAINFDFVETENSQQGFAYEYVCTRERSGVYGGQTYFINNGADQDSRTILCGSDLNNVIISVGNDTIANKLTELKNTHSALNPWFTKKIDSVVSMYDKDNMRILHIVFNAARNSGMLVGEHKKEFVERAVNTELLTMDENIRYANDRESVLYRGSIAYRACCSNIDNKLADPYQATSTSFLYFAPETVLLIDSAQWCENNIEMYQKMRGYLGTPEKTEEYIKERQAYEDISDEEVEEARQFGKDYREVSKLGFSKRNFGSRIHRLPLVGVPKIGTGCNVTIVNGHITKVSVALKTADDKTENYVVEGNLGYADSKLNGEYKTIEQNGKIYAVQSTLEAAHREPSNKILLPLKRRYVTEKNIATIYAVLDNPDKYLLTVSVQEFVDGKKDTEGNETVVGEQYICVSSVDENGKAVIVDMLPIHIYSTKDNLRLPKALNNKVVEVKDFILVSNIDRKTKKDDSNFVLFLDIVRSTSDEEMLKMHLAPICYTHFNNYLRGLRKEQSSKQDNTPKTQAKKVIEFATNAKQEPAAKTSAAGGARKLSAKECVAKHAALLNFGKN